MPAGEAPSRARGDEHDRYSGRSAAGVPGPRGLIGREREFSILSDLVGRSGDLAGGALVVRGEPGIGKSGERPGNAICYGTGTDTPAPRRPGSR